MKITQNLLIDKVKSPARHDILHRLNMCNFLAGKNQASGAIYGFNFWRNSSLIVGFPIKILMSLIKEFIRAGDLLFRPQQEHTGNTGGER